VTHVTKGRAASAAYGEVSVTEVAGHMVASPGSRDIRQLTENSAVRWSAS
jgi:hypothetical protein